MTSRDLVSKALSFQGPERLPLLFRTDPDRSDIVCPSYLSAPVKESHASGIDEWGCLWSSFSGGGAGRVMVNPLAGLQSLDGCVFPNPRSPGRFDGVRQCVKQFPEKYVAGSMGLSGFNLMIALRGFTNLMIDLWLNEQFLAQMMDVVCSFELGVIEQYAGAGVQGVWFFDDWGTDHSLFVNPEVWRKSFKPFYARQFKLAHDKGLHVFFHSCGYVWDIIQDLVEIGADCLNLEQPCIFGTDNENGIDRLAKTYGGKVCVCTNPDLQTTLGVCSPEAVLAEAAHIVEVFSGFQGGLIALADCGADAKIVPPAHLRAMEQGFAGSALPALRTA